MFLFEKIAKKITPWTITADTPKEVADFSTKLWNTLVKSFSGTEFYKEYYKRMHQYEAAYWEKMRQAEEKANQVRLPGGASVDKRDFGNLGVDNMSPNTINMGVLNGMIFNDPKSVMESYHNTMQIANGFKSQKPKSITDYAIPAAGVGVAGVGAYAALKGGSRMPMPMPMYSSAPGYGYGYGPAGLRYEQDYYH